MLNRTAPPLKKNNFTKVRLLRETVKSLRWVVFLAILLLSPWQVSAHEQKALTIILLENGAVVGNISDPSFVQGNGLYFRMGDDTEGAQMRIMIDLNLNGVFDTEDYASSYMVHECELDENGSLVQSDCRVSTTYMFAGNATVSTYTYWVERIANDTSQEWSYSVVLHPDLHVENGGPVVGDCFGVGCDDSSVPDPQEQEVKLYSVQEELAFALFIFSGFATSFLLLSIIRERDERANDGGNEG